ncbi:hypothetical protein FHS82_003198 [Pseudochelatococcus lubricantis]|uniref:Uncharacterized protein n=1 Tax=Pseudochelatococcus lubricantis TaxID=1538102 RepID=A0ABX0V290_9HYPH|nr:hypothetical protein [Pseudochelatococcus lubricantis]NIJ59343.1 hypothetical protein [Pseudochelatococcus lubricantis]
MTAKQYQPDTTAIHDTAAVQAQRAAIEPTGKRLPPPFRALGIPALAAATRRAQGSRDTAKAAHDLPVFLRQPHYS